MTAVAPTGADELFESMKNIMAILKGVESTVSTNLQYGVDWATNLEKYFDAYTIEFNSYYKKKTELGVVGTGTLDFVHFENKLRELHNHILTYSTARNSHAITEAIYSIAAMIGGLVATWYMHGLVPVEM